MDEVIYVLENKMKRLLIITVLVLLFFSTASAFYEGGSSNRTVELKLKLGYGVRVQWAKLYINGRYKGHIRKSEFRHFNLQNGKRYRIKIVRKYESWSYIGKKTIFLNGNKSIRVVIIRQLLKRHSNSEIDEISGEMRRVRVKLSSSSPINWGWLYIDGESYGKAWRKRGRFFELKAGRYHRFMVRREIRGTFYQRKRRIYIGRGETTRTIYLKPMEE